MGRFPWRASGRVHTLGATDGLTKLILEAETERLIGMGIVGPGVEDLIVYGALAIEMGAVAQDVALTIHPHPTLSETVAEAAEVFLGMATDIAPAAGMVMSVPKNSRTASHSRPPISPR